MTDTRISILVNSASGTARSVGVHRLQELLETLPSDRFKWDILAPEQMQQAVPAACRDASVSAVVIGGGDGTISKASALCVQYRKPLGVLPLGTMNLFARTIGMPLDLEAAIAVLPDAVEARTDIGQVNGRVFLNHVSVGLHPQFVLIRDQLESTGRLSKILNGVKGFAASLKKSKGIQLGFEGDFGSLHSDAALAMIFVNPVQEELGTMPVNPGQTAGRLALYLCTSVRSFDLVGLTANAALGLWDSSPYLEKYLSDAMSIEAESMLLLSIDGEISMLKPPLDCAILRQSLKVLRPSEGARE